MVNYSMRIIGFFGEVSLFCSSFNMLLLQPILIGDLAVVGNFHGDQI